MLDLFFLLALLCCTFLVGVYLKKKHAIENSLLPFFLFLTYTPFRVYKIIFGETPHTKSYIVLVFVLLIFFTLSILILPYMMDNVIFQHAFYLLLRLENSWREYDKKNRWKFFLFVVLLTMWVLDSEFNLLLALFVFSFYQQVKRQVLNPALLGETIEKECSFETIIHLMNKFSLKVFGRHVKNRVKAVTPLSFIGKRYLSWGNNSYTFWEGVKQFFSSLSARHGVVAGAVGGTCSAAQRHALNHDQIMKEHCDSLLVKSQTLQDRISEKEKLVASLHDIPQKKMSRVQKAELSGAERDLISFKVELAALREYWPSVYHTTLMPNPIEFSNRLASDPDYTSRLRKITREMSGSEQSDFVNKSVSKVVEERFKSFPWNDGKGAQAHIEQLDREIEARKKRLGQGKSQANSLVQESSLSSHLESFYDLW